MEEFFAQIRDADDLEQLAKDTNAKLDPLLNQK
jgi:N,N'-diacetylchitobiose transport system substrate-binding protein